MNYEVLWFSPVCERIAPSTRGARIISNLSTFTKETAVMVPKGSWRSHGTQHFKKCCSKLHTFTVTHRIATTTVHRILFFAYFAHLEHGTPTTKIPSVRHFQNLKSAFWEAYMGKSLRRRRIFFFGGGFFSPPPPTRKPDLWLVCIPPRPVVYKFLAPNLVEAG